MNMRLRYTLNLIARVLTITSALFINEVTAASFRASTWNGINSTTDAFLRDVTQRIEKASHGDMQFDVYSGGTLLPARGSLEGLQWGMAHIGNITAAYIPAKMPVDFVAVDVSFTADDQLALAFAKTEVSFFNEQMQREINDLDIVFATSYATDVYYFICGFDAKYIDDLNGKKVRITSDAQAAFMGSIGAVPVTVPASEIYTGIQRSTLDCTAGTALFLTDFFKLHEVAKSVYKLPVGSSANGGFYMNQAFWQQRSVEERELFMQAMAEATAVSMVDWAGRIDQAWQTTRDSGIPIYEAEAEAFQQLEVFTEKFMGDLAASSMERRNIEDPTPLIKELQASIKKWKTLLATIDKKDVNQVTALLNQEIFNKLDLTRYGVKPN